ncbi:recombinase family protein [Micropruina sonneratiae]|uniref:recombinase family protein n=1 Tax=Micropruina sonneratiae TaxID=2986940 RepID=UPI002227F27D|nr:recombinase family protein [Micropruina sp. KQZ13P-5]MCW3159394.1 recombinase family protein [Micropruina sp. KQZ13P-5]
MRSTPSRPRVIGYIRVSTNKQENGPEAQARDLQIAADLRGWDLDIRRERAASGKSLAGRPVQLLGSVARHSQ